MAPIIEAAPVAPRADSFNEIPRGIPGRPLNDQLFAMKAPIAAAPGL
jgi:hypothetical protein